VGVLGEADGHLATLELGEVDLVHVCVFSVRSSVRVEDQVAP
jgi:hypothetical protein